MSVSPPPPLPAPRLLLSFFELFRKTCSFISASFAYCVCALDSYASVSVWYSMFGLAMPGAPFALAAAAYYALRPSAAAAASSALFASPDMRVVTAVWRLMDHAVFRWVSRRISPRLAVWRELELTHRHITEDFEFGDVLQPSASTASAQPSPTWSRAVLRSPPMHSRAVMLSPSSAAAPPVGAAPAAPSAPAHTYPYAHALAGPSPTAFVETGGGPWSRRQSLSLASLRPERPIRVTLLSSVPLLHSVHTKLFRVGSATVLSASKCKPSAPTPLLLYLHGGGWVTSFWASDMLFLSRWSERTGCPILYVDYSLGQAYPAALNECFSVYRWIVSGGLGFTPSRIILVRTQYALHCAQRLTCVWRMSVRAVCYRVLLLCWGAGCWVLTVQVMCTCTVRTSDAQAGDSAGGHLAVATCIQAITDPENIRQPDGLILAYPTLNLSGAVSSSKVCRPVMFMSANAPRLACSVNTC